MRKEARKEDTVEVRQNIQKEKSKAAEKKNLYKAVKFGYQLTPVFIMLILLVCTEVKYKPEDFIKNLLQIVMVDASVAGFKGKKGNKWHDRYPMILILSCVLYVICEMQSLAYGSVNTFFMFISIILIIYFVGYKVKVILPVLCKK